MIKNYIATSFIALFLFLFLAACSDKELMPVLVPGDIPAITSPSEGSSFVLSEDTADDIFTEFSWTAATFGFAAGVTYTLEMDIAGSNFSAPVTLGVGNVLSITSVTNGKINEILLAKGLPGTVSATIEIRVAATVSPEVEPLLSKSVSIEVTPFEAEIIFPKLQVPGDYQGWDPANDTTIIHSVKSDGIFEGFIYFPEETTEYKFTDGPAWDVNWGDNDADGTLESDGANIKVTAAGQYKINVNINDLTHTSAKTDWGLIGSATPNGWDSDQDMTFDPTTGIWSITLDLATGEIKFRANDDWEFNFGDDDGNISLEYEGANIAIEEDGNYTVELILNVPVYTYRVTKN